VRRELGMAIALVLLCLGLFASNQDFLGPSNVVNTVRQISMLGIFAIGISFVIVTGGIDLSIGSVIGLTGVLIAKMSGEFRPDSPASGGLGWSLWVGIPAALAVAASRRRSCRAEP
jgi:ribose transport system permease protein